MQPPEQKSKPRSLQDHSRSPGSSGHWYSGQSNPLTHTTVSRSTGPVKPHPSRVRDRVERRRQSTGENWVWVIIATTMLGLTLIATMILIFVLRTDENNDGTALANNQAFQEPTSIIYGAVDADTDGGGEEDQTDVRGALDGNSMVIEPWDGNERFTVLVMGQDTRPGESGLCRTDTLMVVSIDPASQRIGILSIPRDTYVEVPNYAGLRKINTACVLGNLELPGKGPILAMQTVQYNFGIRVNDYFLINFQSFIDIIDRIGGVDVYVERAINDPRYPDMNYGYDPFYIDAGEHHLDGATALKYARSRHSTDDIDRGRRQQQIMFAVRSKVLSTDMIDDLIAQALPLWNDVNDGIETGLSLEQLIRLALYAKDIPDGNIQSGVVDWDYLRPWTTEQGGAVLVPNRYKLPELMAQVFGPNYNR